jgi:hypothetical protein
MNRSFLWLVVLGGVTACSTAPPPAVTADNPASPLAAEATEYPLRNSLAADDLTKKTHRILAKASEQQEPTPAPTPEQH